MPKQQRTLPRGLLGRGLCNLLQPPCQVSRVLSPLCCVLKPKFCEVLCPCSWPCPPPCALCSALGVMLSMPQPNSMVPLPEPWGHHIPRPGELPFPLHSHPGSSFRRVFTRRRGKDQLATGCLCTEVSSAQKIRNARKPESAASPQPGPLSSGHLCFLGDGTKGKETG